MTISELERLDQNLTLQINSWNSEFSDMVWGFLSDIPVWIQCVISREEKVLPMIPGGKTVDDMIVE